MIIVMVFFGYATNTVLQTLKAAMAAVSQVI